MKILLRPYWFVLLLSALTLLACGTTAPASPATPTVDVSSLAGTAIAATATSAANQSALVNTAVAATTAAMPAPTPATVIEYTTMSEEELAALIDQSVNEALAASQQATNTTTQATSDGTVTQEETVTVQVSAVAAEQAIAEAEALMEAYANLYGAYASEAIASMNAIEEDLNSISQSLETMASIAEQGSQNAQAAIEQLNAAAQSASQQASEVQTQVSNLMTKVKSQLDQREQGALAVKPDKVAQNPAEAVESARKFAETFRSALGDKKITPDELNKIAQLGANASAGLKAHGGPQSSESIARIDALTRQAARGQWPQARKGLDEFEGGLPRRK